MFRLVPDRREPWGPEPHYHDVEEYWLFVYGFGEVGLGAAKYEVAPNSVVFTPPGVVHRFHMWTPSRVVAAISRLKPGLRAGHLLAFDPTLGMPSDWLSGLAPANDYMLAGLPVDVVEPGEGFVLVLTTRFPPARHGAAGRTTLLSPGGELGALRGGVDSRHHPAALGRSRVGLL